MAFSSIMFLCLLLDVRAFRKAKQESSDELSNALAKNEASGELSGALEEITNSTDVAASRGDEICCMCQKWKRKKSKYIAFDGEDYKMHEMGKCKMECLSKCLALKGGSTIMQPMMFGMNDIMMDMAMNMGCIEESKLRQAARSASGWASAFSKLRTDDRKGDYC